ncbi:hypothetical protein KL912_002553 [Ogataea haglerorum]|nr:hypothetical protein KL912_002553 [Ogataea haglerorum]
MNRELPEGGTSDVPIMSNLLSMVEKWRRWPLFIPQRQRSCLSADEPKRPRRRTASQQSGVWCGVRCGSGSRTSRATMSVNMKETDVFMQQLVDELSFEDYGGALPEGETSAENNLYPTPPLDSSLAQIFSDSSHSGQVPRYYLDGPMAYDAVDLNTQLEHLIDQTALEKKTHTDTRKEEQDTSPESNYNWRQVLEVGVLDALESPQTTPKQPCEPLSLGQDKTPCRGLDFYRIQNNISIRAFEAFNKPDSKYIYQENRKYGTNLYEPAVNRKLNPQLLADETGTASRKKSVNTGNFALCPFCPMTQENSRNEFQKLFFKRNDSNYLHHMIQFHGVFSNGRLVKDPPKRGWLFSKETAEPVEVVECPYCSECITLKKYKASNPDEHRLLKYLRHVKEHHKTGKNLQQVSFLSEKVCM